MQDLFSCAQNSSMGPTRLQQGHSGEQSQGSDYRPRFAPNAVRRAMVLSNQKTHLVKFSFSENLLEVVVVNKEIGGEAKEKIAMEYRGSIHHRSDSMPNILMKLWTSPRRRKLNYR